MGLYDAWNPEKAGFKSDLSLDENTYKSIIDAPVIAPPKPETGYLKGTAQAIGRGIAGGAEFAGDALQDNTEYALTGDKSKLGIANIAGQKLSDTAAGVKEWVGSPEAGNNGFKQALFEGVESVPLSGALAIPGIAAAYGGRVVGGALGAVGGPVGAVGGALAGGTGAAALAQTAMSGVMHKATRQQTLEELDKLQTAGKLRPDVTPEQKLQAAEEAARAEWQGELPSSIVESLIYSKLPAGKTLQTLLRPGIKQFAKNIAMSAPLELGGEAYTAHEQTSAINQLLKPENQQGAKDAALHSLGPTSVMTTIMAGMGVGGQRLAMRNLAKSLESDQVPETERYKAAVQVAELLKRDHSPEAASNFLGHAADAIGSKDETGSDPYGLNLSDPALLLPKQSTPAADTAQQTPVPDQSGLQDQSGLPAGQNAGAGVPSSSPTPAVLNPAAGTSMLSDANPQQTLAGQEQPSVARDSAPITPVSSGPLGNALAAGGIGQQQPVADVSAESALLADEIANTNLTPVTGDVTFGSDPANFGPATMPQPDELALANHWADQQIAAGNTYLMNTRNYDKSGKALIAEWKKQTGFDSAQPAANSLAVADAPRADLPALQQQPPAVQAVQSKIGSLIDQIKQGKHTPETAFAELYAMPEYKSLSLQPQQQGDTAVGVDGDAEEYIYQQFEQAAQPDQTPTAPAAPAAPAKQQKPSPSSNPQKDDMVTAIAKMGGVSADQVRQQAGTTLLDDRHQLKAGIRHAITKNGKPLDSMREALVEQGYLPEGSTTRDLIDAMIDHAQGKPTYSNQRIIDYDAQLREQEARQLQDMIDMGDIPFSLQALNDGSKHQEDHLKVIGQAFMGPDTKYVDWVKQMKQTLGGLFDSVKKLMLKTFHALKQLYKEKAPAFVKDQKGQIQLSLFGLPDVAKKEAFELRGQKWTQGDKKPVQQGLFADQGQGSRVKGQVEQELQQGGEQAGGQSVSAEPAAPRKEDKQPWEMTREKWNAPDVRVLNNDEVQSLTDIFVSNSAPIKYAKSNGSTVYQNIDDEGNPTSPWQHLTKTGRKLLKASEHKSVVERALSDGKPVPAEVMADYPDLTQAAKSDQGQGARGKRQEEQQRNTSQTPENGGMAQKEAKPAAPKPAEKPPVKTPPTTSGPSTKPGAVTDAGEELQYNKRNRVKGIKWEDVATANDAMKAKQVQKNTVYPKPDYQALVDSGMPEIIAHLVKQVYDAVPNGPVTRGIPTDEDFKTYITAVNRVMDGAFAWAENRDAVAAWAQKQARVAGAMQGMQTALSDLANVTSLYDTVYPGGWRAFATEVRILGSNTLLSRLQPGYDEARRAMKDLEKGWPGKVQAWQRQGLSIIEKKSVSITKHEGWNNTGKIDLFAIGTTRDHLKTFTDRAEADEFFANMGDYLLLTKYKRLISSHATNDEAVAAAKAKSTKERDAGPAERGMNVSDAERTGPAHRLPGQDVSSQQVMDTFGFRGINFGNWVPQDERQLHLNHLYDSFFDLAELLGVPPKAVSLNGMLGIAVGAQGGGNASAHFVPGLNEINVTRTAGAGALAHEWGHAVDHYFGNMAGFGAGFAPYLSYNRKNGTNGTVRPEIVEAFKRIVTAMKEINETPEQVVARVERIEKSVAENFQKYLARMEKHFAAAPEAVQQQAKGLFDKLRAEQFGDGCVSISSKSAVFPVVADLYQLNRSHKLKLPLDDFIWLHQAAYSVNRSTDPEQIISRHQPVRTSTNYLKQAQGLDAKKQKPYWSTPEEMFARAFDAYLTDRLQGLQRKNSYLSELNTDEQTSPHGVERTGINQAFDALLGELKTKETEKGIALYSATSKTGSLFTSGLESDTILEKPIIQIKGITPVSAAILRNKGLQPVEVQGETSDMLRSVADRFGLRVMFYRAQQLDAARDGGKQTTTDRSHSADGFITGADKKTIFLNVNSGRHLQFIIGHEISHALDLNNEKAYQQLLVDLFPYLNKEKVAEYEAFLKTNPVYSKLDTFGAYKEVVADALGELFVSKNGWSSLAVEKPTLFSKLADAVIRVLDKIKELFTNKVKPATFFTDYAKVNRILINAIKEYADNNGGTDGLTGATKEYYAAAWHGSPHDHDKFSTDKIGTGEGAQAYGWGLYFAGNKEVAEYYRKALSARDYEFTAPNGSRQVGLTEWVNLYASRTGGFAQYDTFLEGVQSIVSRNKGDVAKAVQTANSLKRQYPIYSQGWAFYDDIATTLLATKADKFTEKKGRLYKVELAPAEEDYLLWDKPLSDQSEKVKAALESTKTDERIPVGQRGFDETDTGRDVYELTENTKIPKEFGKTRKERASNYLHSLGIRGIKYLDGNSRNRPIKDIKKAFLSALPEDAEFSDVMELVGTGKFSQEQEALLKALEADDWLGFDYPAQAISAALGNDLKGFDPSKALSDAVAELAKDQQFNYVIFNDADVTIEEKFSLTSPAGTGLNAADLQREFDGVPFKSKIKVVQTAEELPGFGRRSLFSKMVEGQYKDGTIYLVAGNLASVERARIVALGHELTHAGQNTQLVNMAVQWFRDAQTKGENGSRFQQAAMKILKDEAGKRGYDIREEADFVKAVKEATAVIAEYAYKNGDTSGLMTRLFIYLKHWLRKQGIAIKFSDKELLSTVTMMMRQGEKNLTDSTGPDGGQFSTVAPEGGKEYDNTEGDQSNEASAQRLRSEERARTFNIPFQAALDVYRGNGGTSRENLEALKRYAAQEGLIVDDAPFYAEWEKGKKIHGGENTVLFRNGYAEKLNDLGYHQGDISEFMNRMIAHNSYFPAAAYELIGFVKKKEQLLPMVRQGFVEAATDVRTSLTHIAKELTDRGFTLADRESGMWFTPDGKYEMFDAGRSNVITDTDGNLNFIDAVFLPAKAADASFSLASPTLNHAQDIMQDLWNDVSGTNLLKSMAKTINPFDYSRSSQWFDRVLPESVKNTISYLFRTPVNQAAVDPDKQPFVDAALEREETKIGFNLALKGWDGKTKSTTFFGRMKEAVTQWENHDKATAWGRIQDEFVKLSADQRDAVNTLLDQGDYRYTVYKTLDGALKNKQIAMRKPTAEAFALYQKVRHHIDVVVAHERERIFIEMAREAGLSKPEIEKHIADYRNSLAQRPGWLPRNHGNGKHQANVYHIIEALEFDQRDVEGGRKQAFLPYYAGPDVTKALVKLVDEINKKYGDDQKDNRLKFASVAGTNLLPNGQMSITGQAADIATLLQQAEGILPDLKKKHAARLSQLKEARSLASENNATKAELRRLDQSIKDMGDGTIKVKVYMSLFESKLGAEKTVQRLEKDLKKEMPKNFKPGRKYEIKYAPTDHIDEDTFGNLTGDLAMERAQLEALKKAYQSGEVTREEADEMKKAIIKTSAETLMGRGAGRHQIERAPYLIEGYTNDNSLQAYTDYMDSTAGMLSKAMYAREQFDNLRYAKPEVKKWADTYITDTLKNQTWGDQASGTARSIASVMTMGLKISSVLINATQVYTLGVADLGRRTKQNSVTAILKAQTDIMKGRLSADEKALFDGKIWKLQEMENVVNEMTGALEGAGGAFSKHMHIMASKAMMPFQEMELFNRRTMLLAAYRVGLGDGLQRDDALKFAVEVNRAVNFEMSRANLPGFARNPVGRTLYSLQAFMTNTWNWIYDRATSGEKADMIALLKYGALVGLFGGATALAGGDELDKLYRRLYGRSIKLDLQQFSRKHLKEYGTPGEMLHGFVWHGGAGLLGVNISNSLRLNNPVVDVISGEKTLAEAVLGVWYGLANKGAMAIKAAGKGDMYRAIESAGPEVLSGAMRAYRQYDRGVTTLSGKVVYDENGQPAKYDAADALLRMTGLQPLQQSERTELTSHQMKLQRHWKEKNTNVVDTLRIAETPAERKAAMQGVIKYNVELNKSQAKGLPGLKISMETINNAVQQRRTKADQKKSAWQQNYLN